jgi:hypothetical protein
VLIKKCVTTVAATAMLAGGMAVTAQSASADEVLDPAAIGTTRLMVQVEVPRGGFDSRFVAGKWAISCDPTKGTHPSLDAVCDFVTRDATAVSPVIPANRMCTMNFEEGIARVYGVLHGRRVDSTFTRSDGCGMSRWNRASILLDVAR